jgi:glycosyltransferase involved in cell wall biosynthesis
LQQMTQDLCLEERVLFIDRVPYEEMMRYTKSAYLGLILENIHVSHEHLFALPNKLFDYLHAGLPVVATPAVEVEKVIRKYDVGIIVEQLSPRFIADKIIALEKDAPLYKSFKQNAQIAAEDHCWENEEKKIMGLMKNIR